jgi:hypothetical protein
MRLGHREKQRKAEKSREKQRKRGAAARVRLWLCCRRDESGVMSLGWVATAALSIPDARRRCPASSSTI